MKEKDRVKIDDALVENINESRDRLLNCLMHLQLPVEIMVLVVFMILFWRGTEHQIYYQKNNLIIVSSVAFIAIVSHVYSIFLAFQIRDYISTNPDSPDY